MPNKNSAAFLIFVLTLAFYVYTLLPSLAWGDGVKLQSEAIAGESFVLAEMTPAEFSPDPYVFSRLGVAAWDHPLYIVLGHILVKSLPFVDSLWLVNLISAIFGAGSVALVFLLTHRFTASIFASGYSALSLAVSHTFWWHSSTPEVYTLFVFLFLLSFCFFNQFETSNQYAFLGWSAFFWGLAASTHILAWLAVPALSLYYFLFRKDRASPLAHVKKLLGPALGFTAGFSLYLIQFMRMSANFSFDEIMGPVVGSTFLSQLVTLSPGIFMQSVLTYLSFLIVQFSPVGILLGVLGIRKAFKDTDLSLRSILSFFIVFALFGIFYRVTDQFTFFIPSYIFWALLMGIGAKDALKRIPEKRHFLLPIVLASLLLATPFFYQVLPRLAEDNGVNDDAIAIPEIGVGVRNGLAYYVNPNKRGDNGAYEFGYQTISNVGPSAIIIAEWYTDTDEYFILRYFTKVAKVRSDVTVLGWPTEDPFSFDSKLVLKVIEDSLPDQTVYLASLSDRFYAASKLIEMFCIVRENNLYRIYPEGSGHLQCLGEDAVTE